MNTIKCVVVGDAAVGKTCLLISFTSKTFPMEYTPTPFDNYSTNVVFEGKPINIGLWDTNGHFEQREERTISYLGADVIIVCYALDNETSYVNVLDCWYKEIKEFCPGKPIVLVGTKSDLRFEKDKKCLEPYKGLSLETQISASIYLECSAKTHTNLKRIFDECVRLALKQPNSKQKTKSSFCPCMCCCI